MNSVRLLHAAYLWVLLFWLMSCQRIQEQISSQADSPTLRDTTITRFKRTWPGFVYASDRQEDSMKAVFVQERKLTHAFGDFYKTPTGAWLLVHYLFGIPAGAQQIFGVTPCPVLDSTTFEVHGNYWQDHNGAYYEAIDNFSPRIATIPQADLATFKSLGFDHLAVDKYHVFRVGAILSGLQPATLKVYSLGGELTEGSYFNNSAYLISEDVIYAPDGQRLTAKQAARFRLPRGYKLAYPLHRRPTRRGK